MEQEPTVVLLQGKTVKSVKTKATSLAEELRLCGVLFPVTYQDALKYRGVGKAIAQEWVSLGLCSQKPPRIDAAEKRIMELKNSLKFYTEHSDRIRVKIRELEEKLLKSTPTP